MGLGRSKKICCQEGPEKWKGMSLSWRGQQKARTCQGCIIGLWSGINVRGTYHGGFLFSPSRAIVDSALPPTKSQPWGIFLYVKRQ